jgi:hypothetical protein
LFFKSETARGENMTLQTALSYELCELISENLINFRNYGVNHRELIIEILEKFETIENAKGGADPASLFILEELLRAMQADDQILTADIIEYEILPKLKSYEV